MVMESVKACHPLCPHPRKTAHKVGGKKMARFNEDVMVRILVNLPVKSLLRFRCVCKSWYRLIKSPYFISMHLIENQRKNDSILVVYGLKDKTASLMYFHSFNELPSSDDISPAHIEIPHLNNYAWDACGPCNGLLCVVDARTIVLCNPALREFKVLPPFPFPFPCPEGWTLCVDAIGFGFDSETEDYKVIAFVTLNQRYTYNPVYKFGIYNLSTNSWREIEVEDDDWVHVSHVHGFGTPFRGAYHWIMPHEIVYFDMSSETFGRMMAPYIDPIEQKRTNLTIINESLALIAYTDAMDYGDPREDNFQFVDIWVMHQYGVAESWTKQLTVGPVGGIWCPFLLWENKAILLEDTEGQLSSFALDTQLMNGFNIYGSLTTLIAKVYQESLISIK